MNEVLIGENMSFWAKSFSYFWKFVFLILFVLAHYFIFQNIVPLSRDLLTGDLSGEKIRVRPQYGFLRIPNNVLANENKAHDRLAGDFAQIYFSLKKADGLTGNYISGESDPWARPSRIAPLIHYVCAQTYCKLKYGPSSLTHLYLQLGFFYVALIAVFIHLKIVRHLPLTVLLVNVGLFLTPAGLAWFERGQYSLYVAMAYLFVAMGILKRNPLYFLLGGLFAFIKWTSFPTLFVLIAVYAFSSRNLQSLKSKILVASPFPAVILLMFSFHLTEGYYFVQGLLFQEALIPPGGVSLVSILPVTYVKLLPAALIILGIPYIRKYGENYVEYIPLFVAVSIIMLMYPTVAFEYSLSTLFGFIPLVVYWYEYHRNSGWTTARISMKYIFLVFLLIASNSPFMAQIFRNNYIAYWEYALVSVVFLFVPLMPSFNRSDNVVTMQAAS